MRKNISQTERTKAENRSEKLEPIKIEYEYKFKAVNSANLMVSACCQNADAMTINVYGAGSSGTVLSTSSSSNTVSGTENGLVAGKYIVVVWAHLNSGETDSKQVEIVIKESSISISQEGRVY